MFTLDGIRKLHGWTHASLSLLLHHLSTLSPDHYVKEVPGFGLPTLRQQVLHVFNGEGFWIHVLLNRPYRDREPAEYPTIADARLLQKEVRLQSLEFLTALSNDQLNAATELRFPDGDVAIRTPALVFHHVLTHAFHHKGQIVAMCRLLGHPAPDTDLNQFA